MNTLYILCFSQLEGAVDRLIHNDNPEEMEAPMIGTCHFNGYCLMLYGA
jgi:hypothetical protein